MHGIARVRTTEEEKIRKKKERDAKLVVYKSKVADIFQKRSQNILDEETLKLTSELLVNDPDFSTVWNYRREIILFMIVDKNDAELADIFNGELRLAEACLKVNPKSYCAWYHRIWVLQTHKKSDWRTELTICNAYLKLDERNFHCWDYRNYIVSNSDVDLNAEFGFTTKKIEENFSNYSAWHYRSKLLTKLYPVNGESNSIQENKHRDELELVIHAAFTDPNDTSAWFYQRWLLGASHTNIGLAVCRITPAKSFITFNKSVCLLSSTWIAVVQIDDITIKGTWKSLYNYKYDVTWILEHDQLLNMNDAKNISVVLKNSEAVIETVICDNIRENQYVGYAKASFAYNFGDSVIAELKKQQESCEQLLEFEPDSKWTYLTLTVILHSINHLENYKQCLEIVEKLTTLDPKRKNYYQDLFSRWHLEYCIENHFDCVKNGKFIAQSQTKADVKITSLYHIQYWSACTNVDLRGFNLASSNLMKLLPLQNCQVLDLGKNDLKSLSKFPSLPELQTLYLDGNDVKPEDLGWLKNCPKLRNVFLDSSYDLNGVQNMFPALSLNEYSE